MSTGVKTTQFNLTVPAVWTRKLLSFQSAGYFGESNAH